MIHLTIKELNLTQLTLSLEMAQALTLAASQVSSAIVAAFTAKSSPRSTSSMSTGISLAKIIENRSKCYWQLSDLKGLKSQCLLTEEDYVHEIILFSY